MTKRFRQLAKPVSKLGLGCNSLGVMTPSEADRLVGAALDAGTTLFDTADIYSVGRSEERLGVYLPRDRGRLTVVTKVGHPASVPLGVSPGAPEHLRRAVHASLRRLRADAIDLYLLHFPDPSTPIADTLMAMMLLIKEGSVVQYGASNFAPAQLDALLAAAAAIGCPAPVAVQAEFNLLQRSVVAALRPLLERADLALIPSFPLASGLLTGKYAAGASPEGSIRHIVVRDFADRFLSESNHVAVTHLCEVCAAYDIALPGLALRWLAEQHGVASLPVGASSAAQFVANHAAITSEVPTPALRAAEACLDSLERRPYRSASKSRP